MDSADNMHDANDVAIYDSEGYAMEEDNDEEDGDDYGYVDNASDDDIEEGDQFDENILNFQRHQANYSVLSEEDIRMLQDEAMTSVSAVLSISKVEAGILLHHFKWGVSEVNDKWFANEAKVRREVGLLERPVVEIKGNENELTCGLL